MIGTRTSFLFDPVAVRQMERELPELLRRIRDVGRAGEPSAAFPRARKCDRQIMRVLASLHYPHLRSLVRSLDKCLGAGYEQPMLLKTRDPAQFRSALSELQVANHLQGRGYAIRRAEQLGEGGTVPEFVATDDRCRVAVEVYTPRQWEDLDVLTDELRHRLENADIPLDFEYQLSVDPLERIDSNGRLSYPDHFAIARELQPARRMQITDALLDPTVDLLERGTSDIRQSRVERHLNIRVSAEVTNARNSIGVLPARRGVISPLGINGYSPEGIFAALVDRVEAKARRSQGPKSNLASSSVLVVDLTYAELTSELWCSPYQELFEAVLRDRMAVPLGGYDMIAFCSWSATGESMQTHYLVARDDLMSLAHHLFELA